MLATKADRSSVFFQDIPRSENYRTHWGKSLDLARIDEAIRNANIGFMRPLTDLGRETLSLDGHLSSVVGKRLNRVSALNHVVTPADVQADDENSVQRAKEFAEIAREQIRAIPNFRARLMDLEWAVFDGRAALEIDWQFRPRGDVRWWIRDLHWIHPRRLSFGRNRQLQVVDAYRVQGDFYDTGFQLESIPWKFITYTPRLFGDYAEREGLSPRCQYWSFFQRFGTRERLALVEIFGKPWRIIEAPEGVTGWDDESLQDAFDEIDSLGSNSTARLPPGYKVQIPQPTQGAGQIHREAIVDAREVISKLVLGNTSTTDAQPTGMNSGLALSHRDSEDLVVAADTWRLSEIVEDALIDAIIAVNFGAAALDLAPTFRISTDAPLDRGKEIENVGKALDAGMVLSIAEVYERSGFKAPDVAKEAVLQKMVPPTASGEAPQPAMPTIVYPVGEAPVAGELSQEPSVTAPPTPTVETTTGAQVPQLVLAPTDLATVVSVNEARATNGLGPLTLPDGSPDPDGKLSIAAYRAKVESGGGTPPAVPPVAGSPGPVAPPAPPAVPPAQGAADDVAPVELDAAPDVPADTSRADLAARMTELGIGRCEHGRANRCTICGIERVRNVSLGDDGEPVWEIAWREIPGGTFSDDVTPTLLADTTSTRDGGMHWHEVDRENETTAEDGAHAHMFEIDGVLVPSAGDGRHSHEIESDALQAYGGPHTHAVILAGSALRTQPDGYHSHEIGFDRTAEDGTHCHSLVLPDGRVVESLDSEDLFERRDRLASSCCPHGVILFGGARQPATVFGSPESMVERGVEAGAVATGHTVERLVEALKGADTKEKILSRLRSAKLDESGLAAVAERELVHSAMLGALDSHFEEDTDEVIRPPAFAGERAETTLVVDVRPSFADMAYGDAVEAFLQRAPLTRAAFDKLKADAKRRAFTVAGLANKRMVQSVQKELAKQIRAGADLRDFQRFAEERLKSAGWVPSSASHVETIFRTNVVNAYSSGRYRQMTEPDVLARRPLWQILTVNDGPPRQRVTHRALHGLVLKADDPFWKKAYPPFGYNCRCRVRSVSKGNPIRGGTIKDIPDVGFLSGTATLL